MSFNSFAERVGVLMQLLELGESDIADAIREVDVDGDFLSPKEFIALIRKLSSYEGLVPEYRPCSGVWLSGETTKMTGKGCTDFEIDVYFRSLDTDKSGNLNLREVSRLLLSSKEAVSRSKAFTTKVLKLRQAADMFVRASKFVETAKSLPPPPPPSTAARLGKLLKEKNVKIVDLQSGWDSDGTGKIDRDEFSTAIVEKLQFDATTEELHALFREFDEDNGGSLKPKELVASLTKLQKEAREHAVREASASSTAENAHAAAEKTQKEAFKMAIMYAPHERT